MTTINNKRSLSERFSDVFAEVAFAEAGELYPEHPHRLRSVADAFTEVAFAESGEEYHVDVVELTPPKVCINGETLSGLCV